MKKILSIILFACCTATAFAQENKGIEVLAHSTDPEPKIWRERGSEIHVEIGGQHGFYHRRHNPKEYGFEVLGSYGYRLNQHIFFGGGTGLFFNTRTWECPESSKTYYTIPLYGQFRCNFSRSRVAPFIDVKAGYGLGSMNGFFTDTALGLDVALNNKTSLFLSVGYRPFWSHEIEHCDCGHDGTYEWKHRNYLSLKAGVCF